MRERYFDRLCTATSEADVVRIAASYLAAWTPQELAAIPAACRPGKATEGEDLADIAYELTRARIESSAPQPSLEEMDSFFAQACARVSQIEAAPYRLPEGSYLTR